MRISAVSTPANAVAMEQATRVYVPAPQYTENHRYIPPIKPAIMPAGAPNISPAQSGEASRTFATAPIISKPYSDANADIAPKSKPITICLCQ